MIPIYQGRRRQRGYGLGSVFSSLFRKATPLLLKGAKSVGKQLLKTGAAVASDVLEGQDIKSSLKERGIEGAKNLGRQAIHQVTNKRKLPQEEQFIQPKRQQKRRRTKRAPDIFD